MKNSDQNPIPGQRNEPIRRNFADDTGCSVRTGQRFGTLRRGKREPHDGDGLRTRPWTGREPRVQTMLAGAPDRASASFPSGKLGFDALGGFEQKQQLTRCLNYVQYVVGEGLWLSQRDSTSLAARCFLWSAAPVPARGRPTRTGLLARSDLLRRVWVGSANPQPSRYQHPHLAGHGLLTVCQRLPPARLAVTGAGMR